MITHNPDKEIPEKILLYIFEHNKQHVPITDQNLYSELDLSEFERAPWSSYGDMIRLSLEKLIRVKMVVSGYKGRLSIEGTHWGYIESLYHSTLRDSTGE